MMARPDLFNHDNTTLRGTAALLSLGAAALVAGCGGGGGDSGRGTAHILLTDAPACGYEQVNVTVERVRLHQSSTAADDDSGWAELVLSPARRINLRELTNGVLADLGSVPLPAGRYTQVRLVLADNGGAAPLANALVLEGQPGTEIALDTPSGQQSGLKIKTNFEVPANQVADLALDFDACRSVVSAGNSGRYNLKPVLSATPIFSAAGQAIEGFLAQALAGATVSAQLAGVPVKATVAASDGRFVLAPVAAGTYDLVFTAPGHATAVITGVPVTDAARTQITALSGTITPIDLPLSTEAQASGSASLTGSSTIPAATVRALQLLGGGPEIELAAQAVDAVTGGYSFTLPQAAPGKAAYAAGASSYSFSADAGAAAKYTLESLLEGSAAKRSDIDIGAGNAMADFVYP